MKKKNKIVIGIIGTTIIIVSVFISYNILFNTKPDETETETVHLRYNESEYPPWIVNSAVFDKATNAVYYGLGQYDINGKGFCGINDGAFLRIDNTSSYENSGNAYEYPRYISYPNTYTLIFDYDTNLLSYK